MNWKSVAAVSAMLAGTACYQYTSSGPEGIQPGRIVRVDLTAPGAATLASTIGPDATALNGRVLTRAGDDVTLAVTQIDRANGPEQFLKGDPIALTLGNLSAISLRSVDKQRTVLTIGGIVAAFVIGRVFLDQDGLFSNKGTPSGNTR